MNALRKVGVPLAAIAIFLALWEFLVWVNGWPNYKMASPSDLPPAYARYWNLFVFMGWQTLWRTVAGLAIAVLVGTFIGMLMGFSRVMRDGLYPLLVGFNAIPKATLVPVIALIFIGLHDFNTVLMAFMISFFPIAVSVGIGLSTLEPEYRDILRALGGSRSGDVVVLPAEALNADDRFIDDTSKAELHAELGAVDLRTGYEVTEALRAS